MPSPSPSSWSLSLEYQPFSCKTHSPFQTWLLLLLLCEISGVPETTLRFNNSPEGPTELSKAVTLTVTVYHSRWIQIKTSIGKSHTGQGPRETRHERPVALSQGVVWTTFTSPATMGCNVYRVLPTQEAHLSPGFSLWVGHVDMADHPHADLSFQSFQRSS